MTRLFAIAAVAMLAFGGHHAAQAGPVQAFWFKQTSSNAQFLVTGLAYIELDFTGTTRGNSGPLLPTLAGSGIDFLELDVWTPFGPTGGPSTTGSRVLNVVYNPPVRDDFIVRYHPGSNMPQWSLSFDDELAGVFNFNTGNDDIHFAGDGTGSFNTDNPAGGACARTGVCHFAGEWTNIPEPASMGLLAMGLVTLAGVQRRIRPGPKNASA